MKTYEREGWVLIREVYSVSVEADSSEEADEKALEMISNGRAECNHTEFADAGLYDRAEDDE